MAACSGARARQVSPPPGGMLWPTGLGSVNAGTIANNRQLAARDRFSGGLV